MEHRGGDAKPGLLDPPGRSLVGLDLDIDGTLGLQSAIAGEVEVGPPLLVPAFPHLHCEIVMLAGTAVQEAYGGRLTVLSKMGDLIGSTEFPLREPEFKEEKPE